MSYLELLKLAAPETLVILAALAVLAVDALALRDLEKRGRRIVAAVVGSLGCLAAIGWMLLADASGNVWDGIWVVNPLTQIIKGALLVLAIGSLVLAIDSDFTLDHGEYIALILLCTVGMMFLVSAQDILVIFLALELTSLPLYILTGFARRSPAAAEAALKYFLFGGMSSAFTLFGLSLVYGLTGATQLRLIAEAIQGATLDPLLLLAIGMTVVGFAFKVAAAPFHWWAPDAYQAAPIPSAALIASGSKVAGFVVLAVVMSLGFAGTEGSAAWRQARPGWTLVIAVIAVVSMVLGNLAALAQTSVRRLLAYSAVAHGGYMLLGVLGGRSQCLAAIVYYAITYALTTLGAFGVVALVQQQTGGDRLADFAGLSRRAPLLSICMMIFMLSLAGIPPLAGFFGKFFVFASLLHTAPAQLGWLWLVILAIALSAVSLYYYLQVLKQIFVISPTEVGPRYSVPRTSLWVISLLALATLLLGCAPQWLADPLLQTARLAGFPV